ncbi:MAG: hypothetical protein ABI699_07735 [Caldimonas sp.]
MRVECAKARTDRVHLFVTESAVLAREAARLRKDLRDDAVLWVSWPTKASRRAADPDEDGTRDRVLLLGWVDVKVCAVAAVWSGLKPVMCLALRGLPLP